MFLSTSHNKIDKKGRVSVPANYRNQIEGEGGPLILFKSLQFKCLEGTSLKRMIQYVDAIDELDGWSKNRAEVSIASAKYDLNIAKEALADQNLPSVERAIARIEASLIEANPDNAMNEENSGSVIDKSLETIRFDEDLVINPSEDQTIPLVDLTEAE